MNLRGALILVAFALVSYAHASQAQDAAEPKPAAQVTPKDVATTGPVAPAPEEKSESRFRWGINAAGGPMLGGYSGGAGGIDARFGMQMNRVLGFYAQPVLMAGAGASANAKGASATGLALYGVGAMVDATFGDLFYVAGGPELLMGGVGTAAASAGGSASASAATGPFFSLAARTGFAFGSMRPDRRKAFTAGLSLHAVFAGGSTAVMPLVALGYEAF